MEETEIEDYFADYFAKLSHTLARYGKEWYNRIIIIKYTQEGVMAVSYNRLWKLLVDRKMSKADLRKASGVAPNTMTKLRRDEEVTLTVLGKICSTLNVDYGDIMEYIDERDDEEHDPGRKGASCD